VIDMTLRVLLLGVVLAASAAVAQPQQPQRFEGTLLTMTGAAELEVANDEALVAFYLEVQEPDLARAQSQVNQRVAEGVAAIRRADPKAVVETSGYGSYPVYQPGSGRKIIGWRARQGVNVRTSELASLPKVVAAGQQQLALGGLDFRLSRAARERVEGELIQRAIANLNARVAAAAQALNVPAPRQRIEEISVGIPTGGRPPPVPVARMQASAAESVAEPQLDAGQSTQQVTLSAKVRFLAP
jgi:predicted secreted protein